MNSFKSIHFVIVGAQKAGTSSLYEILRSHSNITASKIKEIHFFDDENAYSKGIDYYHSFFRMNEKTENNLFFEATPVYLYHPHVAKRLHNYNKNIRIIAILRDPVLRAVSAWNMYHNLFKDNPYYFKAYDHRSFKDAIETEIANIEKTNWYNNKNSYIKRGIYYFQIEEYFKYFSRENILIIDFNDLKSKHELTIRTVCSFLNIPYEGLEKKKINEGPKLDIANFQSEIELLRIFYKPYNQLLFKYLNREFQWT